VRDKGGGLMLLGLVAVIIFAGVESCDVEPPPDVQPAVDRWLQQGR
jgi:hypothetical protein